MNKFLCDLISKGQFTMINCLMTKRCNIKCRNCAMLCNMTNNTATKNDDYSFDEFKSDLLHLKSLDAKIETICMWGGEPFLNKDIFKCIQFSKSLFPQTHINIGTNCTLLPKLSNDEIEILKGCTLIVSIYDLPNKEQILKTLDHLRSSGVFIDSVSFAKLSPMDSNSPNRPYMEKCIIQTCSQNPTAAYMNCECNFLNLYKSNVYRCSTCIMSPLLRKYFDFIPNPDYKKLTDFKSIKEIQKYYLQPEHFCKYCWYYENDVKRNFKLVPFQLGEDDYTDYTNNQ